MFHDVANQVVPLAGDNFTPEKRTPWGGYEIGRLKGAEGHQLIGEDWQVSAHPLFPSMALVTVDGQARSVSLPELVAQHPIDILGAQTANRFNNEFPFLVKLLNSGSWNRPKAQLQSVFAQIDASIARDMCQRLGVNQLSEMFVWNNHDLYRSMRILINEFSSQSAWMLQLKSIFQSMVNKNLSIQIHPSSDYSGLKEGQHSKTEAWYIVDAEDGAGLYLGLKAGVSEDMLRGALEAGNDITDMLNFHPVSPGDTVFIPSGTIHAIGAGVTLIEPQETSATTYRVYDWNREPKRELRVDDTLAVVDWHAPRGAALISALSREATPVAGKDGLNVLVDEDEFSLYKLNLMSGQSYSGDTNDAVQSITVLNASAKIQFGEGQSVVVKPAHSIVIPASVGTYEIESLQGDSDVLITTVR